MSGDAALALAVFFIFLSMMSWGVFQTFWPSRPRVKQPGSGRVIHNPDAGEPIPVHVEVSTRARRR